jgi:hypothetical protein
MGRAVLVVVVVVVVGQSHHRSIERRHLSSSSNNHPLMNQSIDGSEQLPPTQPLYAPAIHTSSNTCWKDGGAMALIDLERALCVLFGSVGVWSDHMVVCAYVSDAISGSERWTRSRIGMEVHTGAGVNAHIER